MNNQQLPEYLKLDEVAALFRVSKLTVKRWGKAGKLVPLRINSRGDRRYTREQIIQYLESLEGKK